MIHPQHLLISRQRDSYQLLQLLCHSKITEDLQPNTHRVKSERMFITQYPLLHLQSLLVQLERLLFATHDVV